MTRTKIVWLAAGVLCVALAVWVANNTEWAEVMIPMPPRGVIDEYIIYVGFDPQGLREPRRPARGRRR